MTKTLSTLAAVALFAAVAGCKSDADKTTIGPDNHEDYTQGHYNPAVNSTGSQVGRTDPAIDPDQRSATGNGPINTPDKSVNGGMGSGNGMRVGGGTSTDTGGSGSGTGMGQ